MQNKYFKLLLLALIVAVVVPQVTLAAWWNPFSWGIWSSLFHWQNYKAHQNQSQTSITAESLKNITLTYPNPYDTSKTDTINLVNGKALINPTNNTGPTAYNVGVTAIGDLNGDSVAEGAIGIYQSYGANIIVPIVFVASNKDGKLMQIDSVLPDTSTWNYETQIKSLSIENGILTVNLLTLAEADQQLPHYQQTGTVPKTVQYKLVNGKLVLQQPDQTANWKTYTNDEYGFTFKYPQDDNVTLANHIPPHGTDFILPNNNFIKKDGSVDNILTFSIFQKVTTNLEKYISDDLSASNATNAKFGLPQSSLQKISINGIDAYEVKYPAQDQQPNIIRVYIQNSEHTLFFQYNVSNNIIAQKILSTFKSI